ncbi:hypothetical protein KFE80_01110 [bacterium SCSIO 12696]|nr:hypothetical protein KFE80_01110 [bacterium SCSIO 12696]
MQLPLLSKPLLSSFLLSLLALCSVYSKAEEFMSDLDGTYSISADGGAILGDTVDIDTGELSFYVVDISVPGNSRLPVQFGRRINTSFSHKYSPMGTWRFDVPQIVGVDGSCGNPWGDDGQSVRVLDTNGQEQSLTLIGKSYSTSGGVLTATPLDNNPFPSHARYATENGWILYCSNGTSGYMIGVSPEGTKYHFDQDGGKYSRIKIAGSYRGDDALYASLVEDVYGNWVRYEYTTPSTLNAPVQLTRIHSNDGREITVGYNSNGMVSSASTNGRTWQYQYTSSYADISYALNKVILPDGRFWTIGDTTALIRENLHSECLQETDLLVKHPNGLFGRFEFRIISNGRKDVDASGRPSDYELNQDCGEAGFDEDDDGSNPVAPTNSLNMAVIRKTLYGSGIPDYTWTYDYEEDLGNFDGYSPQLSDTKERTITDPVGNRMVSYVNRQASGQSWKAGMVERVEYFASGSTSPLQVIQREYQTTWRYGRSVGLSRSANGNKYGRYKFLSKETITRDGDTFTTEYTYNTDMASPQFSFGRPVSVKTYSNVSTTPRETVTAYEHNKAKWVLGLPKTVTQNGRQLAAYNYDSYGRRTSQSRYGLLEYTFSYHSNASYKGALYWAKDALNRTTYFLDYKRGTAQRVKRPDNLSVYQYVDNNGWLTQSRDAKNQATYYTRDVMGRVTLLNPPGSWNNTSVSYNFNNGLVQTVTNGQSRSTTTYDVLGRATLVRTQDLLTG